MPRPVSLYGSLAVRSLGVLLKAGMSWNASGRALSPCPVPEDFFGINIASAAPPETDTYVLQRLQELGIRQVRLDLGYAGLEAYPERGLKRLLDEGYSVLLRLVQPVTEAAAMHRESAARERWHAFLEQVVLRIPVERLSGIEIGCTPNRRRWSGYRHRGYLAAWRIASQVMTTQPVALAGPNVSDFEPLHTIPLLVGMGLVGRVPNIHTHNLFVERVREPEAFDHRVLGRRLAPHLKLNLVRKARLFASLSRHTGAAQTWCTHTCWNGERIARWSRDIESKRADYLVRYLIPAALCGALGRVYWGPLIGATDGLIDDGTGGPGPTERVAFYESVLGEVGNYTPRPAFYALKHLVALLDQATGTAVCEGAGGLFHYTFTAPAGKPFAVCWTRDGQSCPWPEGLVNEAAGFRNTGGEPLPAAPEQVTEHPVFIFRERVEREPC